MVEPILSAHRWLGGKVTHGTLASPDVYPAVAALWGLWGAGDSTINYDSRRGCAHRATIGGKFEISGGYGNPVS